MISKERLINWLDRQIRRVDIIHCWAMAIWPAYRRRYHRLWCDQAYRYFQVLAASPEGKRAFDAFAESCVAEGKVGWLDGVGNITRSVPPSYYRGHKIEWDPNLDAEIQTES